ncbi:pentapeptide repeat-containing protein [Rathayibacter festucae]|uniref:pentapeptide repeat-containing protein n=1 Tax=Rathayibacter festucae TaxID=110937 RepID=UPI003CC552C8
MIIAGLVFFAQSGVDDDRASRDREIASEQASAAERAENLRFVRDRSNADSAQVRPFSSIDLQGVNLAGLSVLEADFSFANLKNSDLSRAAMDCATLQDADLSYSTLRQASLRAVRATDADFSHSKLTNSDLRRGYFLNANFIGADLHEANLANSRVDNANFSGADLTGADLTDSNFTRDQLDVLYAWDSDTNWPTGVEPPTREHNNNHPEDPLISTPSKQDDTQCLSR